MVRRLKRDAFRQFVDSYRPDADSDSDWYSSWAAHLIVSNPHFARLYRIRKIRYEKMARHPRSCPINSDAAWAHRDYARKVGHKWRASRK